MEAPELLAHSCVPAPLCIGDSAVRSSAQSSELTSLQSPSFVCASAPSPCRVCVSTTYLWKQRTTPQTYIEMKRELDVIHRKSAC